MFLIMFFFGFTPQQPETPICTVDQCERNVCIIETPEGWVETKKKDDYYEGKRLLRSECPMDSIEPT